MATWINDDGLPLVFGTDRAIPNEIGEYENDGLLREVELKINLADLTETETILTNNTVFPKSCIIQEIEILTTVAAATGAAIDFGLVRLDRSTEIDYNGLLAAFPTASMNAAGERVLIFLGETYAGDLIGTALANPGYFTMSRTTSTAFTAGEIIIRVRYYRP